MQGEEALLKKLIIVSGSSEILRDPSYPVPAFQRLNGVAVRVARNQSKKSKNFVVLILSPVYGLIRDEKMIPFKEPISARAWGMSLKLSANAIAGIRKSTLSTFQKILAEQHYDEIYVNLGKDMLELIKGFEELVPSNVTVTYSQGAFGQKMSHMKNWMNSRPR